MRPLESKLVTLDRLSEIAGDWRKRGSRLVTTNGCFDLLHMGHIRSLVQARQKGDLLFVGVNSDISVRGLKGPSRPIWDESTRALQLAAIEAVDYVTIFPQTTPETFLRAVRSHVHVKGADYEGKQIPEQVIVAEWGGTIAYIDLVAGVSTTELIRRLKLLGEE